MKKLKEECGIFAGFCFDTNINKISRDGLLKLQHRGEQSCGLSVGNKDQILIKSKGLVSDVLTDLNISKLNGHFALSHVRYSTCKGNNEIDSQPILVKYQNESVSIAHNGHIKESFEIRNDMEKSGETFITSTDTEVILKKIIQEIKLPPSKWTVEKIATCLNKYFSLGAWVISIFLPERILAFRDPYGYRPLMFANTKQGFFIASEDVAFQNLDIINLIEIKAGECIEITKEGFNIKRFAKEVENEKKCIFEHIYFANTASSIFGRNVYESRLALGRLSAIENPAYDSSDIIIPVMDSGLISAIGYSQTSQIPLQIGLLKNNLICRTFIETKIKREKKVKEKYIPIKSVIKDKNIILIDDSLVRGTTAKELIKMLKKNLANRIDIIITSPKLINSCSWGVDIKTKDELIAYKLKTEYEIAKYLNADSIRFLSLEGLKKIFSDTGYCYHCFMENQEN